MGRLDRWRVLRAVAVAGIVLVGVLFAPTASAVGDPAGGCEAPSWVVSWMMPQAKLGPAYTDETVRVVAPLSLGGSAVRVRLTNELGSRAVTFDEVRVGVSAGGPAIWGPNRTVTFGGEPSVTIPAGEYRVSDPIALGVADGQRVSVSLHVPGTEVRGPGHTSTQASVFVATGNRTTDRSGFGFERDGAGAWFVNAVDVLTVNDGAIVGFGDSITEGVSVREYGDGQFRPWPAVLGDRLRFDHRAPRVSVVNAGISGNRLLRPDNGPSALERFGRDALSQTGVGGVIVLEGINDLAPVLRDETTVPPLTEFVAGYEELAQRGRDRGVRVWISPLTPAGDTARPSPFATSATQEQIDRRHEVNSWIRGSSGAYDPRADFEPVLRDERFPDWIRSRYDSGDNLHPNEAGLRAMGSSIDPALFAEVTCTP